jgi:hypothetical protein
VGLFLSLNSSGADGEFYMIRAALCEQFTDRYFPAAIPDEPTVPTALEHARCIAAAGPYESSRRSESSVFRIASLLEHKRVVVKPDGTMVVPEVPPGVDGQPKRWREVGPYVWREVGSKERLVAHVVDGNVMHLSYDTGGGGEVLQPVPTWRSGVWLVPLLIGVVVVLLVAVATWPPLRIFALSNLILLIAWAAVICAAGSDLSMFDGRLDSTIRMLQLWGMVSVLATGIAAWKVLPIGRRGASRWARLWSITVVVCCLIVMWLALAFGLLSFSVDY